MPDTPTIMKNLIRYGELVDNTTQRFVPPEGDAAALPPDEPGWEVPLATWLAARDTLRTRQHPVAVLLGPAADAAELADGARHIDATGIAYIAIEFPAYTDGRGYSIAQQLRSHYNWTGELRAVGDILIDTIHYQARCGFDSFVVKEGHDPQKALQALGTFTVHYQREYPRPLAA
ncbi:DUF934 domain-containing protein [Bordetella sp. N]|uniref:DUF934 domain-containing protein n=1 Tax=Bordetella sp. N TaxID=1746199 RepID=UPI00071099AB|nr:DUF934 domain-containing protein [Bordetella sp. N]ALM84189.1 hypothetical protein ASB57_15495 [Bordetella sp. N]